MNFLKNNLCDDVCGIINEYLMINKDIVYENKKLVIKQLKMLQNFQEADKVYFEGFKKANKQEKIKIIKFLECAGNKYMSIYCNNLNFKKGIYPFHHIKEVNNFYRKKEIKINEVLKPHKFKVGSYYKSYDGIGLYKIIKRTEKFVSVVYVISKNGEHLYNSKKKIRVDENENEFINIHNSKLSLIWSYNIYD